MNFHEFIFLLGNLNYFFTIWAFLMRDVMYLRILSIAASICAIFYYANVDPRPLWINITGESICILVNLVQTIFLVFEKRALQFNTEEERVLYQTVFHKFSPTQFRKIIKIGKFEFADVGQVLTTEGKQVGDVLLIWDGLARVDTKGKTIAYCKTGNLVGEMSFISGEPANATVTIVEPTQYIKWTKEDLEKLLESDITMKQAMQTVFNVDLLHKLTGRKKDEDRA